MTKYAVVVLALCACSAADPVSTSHSELRQLVTGCPGQDLAPFIRAADAAIGARPGLIDVAGGGTVGTQVEIGARHRLHLGAGTYAGATGPYQAMFLVRDGASVYGDGPSRTVLVRPPGYFVVSAQDYGAADAGSDGVSFRDLTIAESGDHTYWIGGAATIRLGNATNATVSDVVFDGVDAEAIEIGDGSRTGHFAQNVRITGCSFRALPGEAVAIVNARSVRVDHCDFDAAFPVDVEPNEVGDSAADLVFDNDTGLAGFIQGAATGPVTVSDSTVSALAVYRAHDVTLTNNTISSGRPYASGLYLAGAAGAHVTGNRILNSGGPAARGGAPAVLVTSDAGADTGWVWRGTTGLEFSNNTVITTAGAIGSAVVREAALGGIAPTGNTYANNCIGTGSDGEAPVLGVSGAGDVVRGNVLTGTCP